MKSQDLGRRLDKITEQLHPLACIPLCAPIARIDSRIQDDAESRRQRAIDRRDMIAMLVRQVGRYNPISI
jgi:hypothetical protein